MSAQSPLPDWDLFRAYEAGKGRRYGLLFAVNGGAFAIETFLFKGPGALPVPLLVWALLCVPAGMIVYTLSMRADISAFGHAMRRMDARPEAERLFGPKGRRHLAIVTALLVCGWASAALCGIYALLGGALWILR